MKLKFKIHYIVTVGSTDGEIKVGDTLLLHKSRKDDTLGHTMFLPVRETQKDFFGLPPMNYVRYFKTDEELDAALEGVEVVVNKKLAEEMVSDLEKKIEFLEKEYNLCE